jgi:hypothetical protein
MSGTGGNDTAPPNPNGTANSWLESSDRAPIQVSIHDVRQLFDSIDPSPFRERDLDPGCEELIVSWAREFPPDRPLQIEIRLDREQPASGLLADVSERERRLLERLAGVWVHWVSPTESKTTPLQATADLNVEQGLLHCLAVATAISWAPGSHSRRRRWCRASALNRHAEQITHPAAVGAVGFGLLLCVPFIAAAALQARFGDAGAYAIAAVAEHADVDAISVALADGAHAAALGGAPMLPATLHGGRRIRARRAALEWFFSHRHNDK